MRATSYIVAATPRSGSSLLCEGLSATSVAGFPNEFFAPDFRWMWRKAWGLEDSIGINSYIESALFHGTSRNGITAFKIQWMHAAPLAEEMGRPGEDALSALLPGARFVNIIRLDRRAQALSWFRAIATNEWWRFGAASGPPPPAFDRAAVLSLEAHLQNQQNAWQRYFAERGIVPLTVEYEALGRDYRGEITRVLQFLGLDRLPAAAIPPPCLSRQADSVTADWRQRLDQASGCP